MRRVAQQCANPVGRLLRAVHFGVGRGPQVGTFSAAAVSSLRETKCNSLSTVRAAVRDGVERGPPSL